MAINLVGLSQDNISCSLWQDEQWKANNHPCQDSQCPIILWGYRLNQVSEVPYGHIVRLPHVYNLHTRELQLLVTSQPIKGHEFSWRNCWLVEALGLFGTVGFGRCNSSTRNSAAQVSFAVASSRSEQAEYLFLAFVVLFFPLHLCIFPSTYGCIHPWLV